MSFRLKTASFKDSIGDADCSGTFELELLSGFIIIHQERMLLTGKLHPHLLEVEQAAEKQKQQMMTELLKQNPAPDKAKNQLMWVQHMNSLKAQVEEVILMELIYN